jgi:hypothetical protein|tara:strand:- start:499 stop:681 length:183 start_codon:yes stop_codon:yes gene_type:complete
MVQTKKSPLVEDPKNAIDTDALFGDYALELSRATKAVILAKKLARFRSTAASFFSSMFRA